MTESARLTHEKVSKVLDGEILDADYEIDLEIDGLEAEAGEQGILYEVKVYRILEGTRKYLRTFTPGEFKQDTIRDIYGTGVYDFWLYKNKKIHRRWNGKEIEAPPDWEPPKTPSEVQKAEQTTDTSHVIVAGLAKLGEMIVQMNQDANNRVAAIQNAQPATPVFDPMAMQASMIGTLVQMKDLFGGGNQGSSAADMMKIFTSGVELAKELGSDKETGVFDVLKEMPKMLSDITSLASQPAPATPAIAAPSATPTAAPQTPQPGDPMLKEMVFKKQLDDLIQRAEKGSDPGLYADLILDRIPEQYIRDFFGGADPFPKLVAINPEVAKHEHWFRSLGIILKEALDDGEPTGENGGPTDDETSEPHETVTVGPAVDAPETDTPTTTGDGDAPRDT